MRHTITITLLVMALTLSSCGFEPCTTEVCLQSNIAMEKLRQEQLIRDRAHEIDKLRIKAEIESSKPTAVKVAEIENDGMSLGEGVAAVGTAAAIGTVIWKIIE